MAKIKIKVEINYDLINEFKEEKVSVSLPSLRVDSFSVELAKEVQVPQAPQAPTTGDMML